MRRADRIVTTLPDAPFTLPSPDFTGESAVSEGRDDEAALAEGGIGPRVALPAQRDQPVAIEV
jgi:hypothetical protein